MGPLGKFKPTSRKVSFGTRQKKTTHERRRRIAVVDVQAWPLMAA